MAAQVEPDGQVPEAVVRRVNGEHKHTNAHARDIKSRSDTRPSMSAWEVDPKLAFNDSYVHVHSTKMYLFPGARAALAASAFLLTLPCVAAELYGSCFSVRRRTTSVTARGSTPASSSPASCLFPRSSWGP